MNKPMLSRIWGRWKSVTLAVAADRLAGRVFQAPSGSAPTAAPPAAAAHVVVGIGFGPHGCRPRQVRGLLQGARLQPGSGANPAWRKDEVIERLYEVKGIETRMAKMFVECAPRAAVGRVPARGERTRAQNLSDHTAWEPGATHFGLVVPMPISCGRS